MRSQSASTALLDPYRAGLALGMELAPCQPEVVFLFCSAQYDNWDELLAGLYDGLGSTTVQVIGSTGDGFFETTRVSDLGACALGLNSGARVRWHLAAEAGVRDDPKGALRRALARTQQAMGTEQAQFYFLLSDFHTDATELEAVVRDEVSVPVVGGLAADDNGTMEICRLFANQQHMDDALVLLAVQGALDFQIHIGNSIAPVGRAGRVTGASGKSVTQIDGMSAADFVELETGKPILRSDQNSMALTVANASIEGERRLRGMVQQHRASDGSLTLYGGVADGELVQVCMASPELLQAEVYRVAEVVRASGFAPCAGLLVSCAGRKNIMGGKVEFEVQAIEQAVPHPFALVGFPSLGEFGPLRHEGRYTRNLFHNMTYVLLLIGAPHA